MFTTNFHLAPPSKTVDGLFSVPIDIQRIEAKLTFDGATGSCSGDATLEFTTGFQGGNPIFDLRQSITAAWLDGALFPAGQLKYHDFGGGAHSKLRVVESLLAAHSFHTLRVKYDLALPDASSAGSYQPSLAWSPGPRLNFNFGFTDLGGGRYLEAWVPSNLIFDQFELNLEIILLNTSIPHTLITNGSVTTLGTNHWSAVFPAYTTALSPLVELRPTESLLGLTDSVILPISGKTINIEIWKLANSTVDLAEQMNYLKTWLPADESMNGAYRHDNRFVAFIHQGGMEYDGGTTTSQGSLRHESFHSWWGRGVKPASQVDGWLDEGWTSYYDAGATGVQPFDFTESPVLLCSRNPWIRSTPLASYSAGKRFWDGVAGLIGVSNLQTLMQQFYSRSFPKPITTLQLEEYLVCQTGEPLLVDAFHRFVYGYADPVVAPDLWLRDDPADTGAVPFSGRFWDSQDLWVRNQDDNGTTHQNPEYGQDNWFYARVRNRSASATARHFLVAFNVKAYAGTEFQYPGDFLPCVAAATGFDLGPGASTIVKARWPAALVPPVRTHACLLASVFTRSDHPLASKAVWEHNNLAQKNLTIVDLEPDGWIVVPFVIANHKYRIARHIYLEIIRPTNYPQLNASLIHRLGTTAYIPASITLHPLQPDIEDTFADQSIENDCGSFSSAKYTTKRVEDIITSALPETIRETFPDGVETAFTTGLSAHLPLLLRSQEQRLVGLRVSVPPDAKPGDILLVDLVQRNAVAGRILGGITIEIHVK